MKKATSRVKKNTLRSKKTDVYSNRSRFLPGLFFTL